MTLLQVLRLIRTLTNLANTPEVRELTRKKGGEGRLPRILTRIQNILAEENINEN